MSNQPMPAELPSGEPAPVPGDPPTKGRAESGQILILYAILLVTLLITAGSALDLGSIVVDDAKLQNAVDASALAGAGTLSSGVLLTPATAVARAQATTTEYLRLDGFATQTPGTVIQFAFPTSTAGPSGTPGLIRENLQLSVTRAHPTYFWTLVGINNVDLSGNASARAARGMLDIMLSLDLTGSMQLAGMAASPPRDDIALLRRAVADFVNIVNPTTTDPRGPQIGIARFAGIKCSWNQAPAPTPTYRPGTPTPTRTPTPKAGTPTATPKPTANTIINIGEYNTPCQDDKTLLTALTDDRATLIKVADNTGAGTCPVGASPFGCPLNHIAYRPTPVTGTPGTSATGVESPAGSVTNGVSPDYTGTKLPNAFTVLNSGGYYAWATANGGRNNAAGEGWARKILVLMTDGQNEEWPSSGLPEDMANWDTQMQTEASNLKLGPDGLVGSNDDVEVYVVGFYCTPYSVASGSWCKSMLADDSPKLCPAATLPPVGNLSAIDQKLITLSSSRSGTCDHYFPLAKTESLPAIFQALAGTISRSQLTE